METLLKDGQTVWVKKIGNDARYYDNHGRPIEEYITETTVEAVNRKYFTLAGAAYSRLKFELETMTEKSEYCKNCAVYTSKQQIYDEEEAKNLKEKIRDKFSGYISFGLSLDQLRRMWAIIEEGKNG